MIESNIVNTILRYHFFFSVEIIQGNCEGRKRERHREEGEEEEERKTEIETEQEGGGWIWADRVGGSKDRSTRES